MITNNSKIKKNLNYILNNNSLRDIYHKMIYILIDNFSERLENRIGSYLHRAMR